MSKLSVLLLSSILYSATGWAAPKCLFINSYHKGYDWSDAIEVAIVKGVKGGCDLQVFYMDTKQNPGQIKGKAQEAKALIDSSKPDVVMMSDDNAVAEILVPFYKNAKIPFIFVGVNWTLEKYQLPFSNTTGMVEVAPAAALIKELKAVAPNTKTGTFLAPDNESERMDAQYIKKIFESQGIKMTVVHVKTFKDWKEGFTKGHAETDFLYLNNRFGIPDWDEKAAVETAKKFSKKPAVAHFDFMAPFVTFAFTKLGAEQGDFAASAALQIIKGQAPAKISIASNQRYDVFLNPEMAEKLKITFRDDLMKRGRKISSAN